jgi:hypothetical protein
MASSSRIVSIAIMVAAVASCAQSSGVMQLAPNTYSIVTADELGGTIAAKRAGLQEATAFCTSKGQQMITMQTSSDVRRDFVGDPVAHHDLTFRCAPPGSTTQAVVGGHRDALIVN